MPAVMTLEGPQLAGLYDYPTPINAWSNAQGRQAFAAMWGTGTPKPFYRVLGDVTPPSGVSKGDGAMGALVAGLLITAAAVGVTALAVRPTAPSRPGRAGRRR